MTAAKPILIVEDDYDVREAIRGVLEQYNYAVAVAADGVQALEYLQRHPPPALILLDIMMPNMDGFHFRAEQMRDPVLAPIPIVVLTASSQVYQTYAEVGACECLGKPIAVDKLMAAVERNYPKNESDSSDLSS